MVFVAAVFGTAENQEETRVGHWLVQVPCIPLQQTVARCLSLGRRAGSWNAYYNNFGFLRPRPLDTAHPKPSQPRLCHRGLGAGHEHEAHAPAEP